MRPRNTIAARSVEFFGRKSLKVSRGRRRQLFKKLHVPMLALANVAFRRLGLISGLVIGLSAGAAGADTATWIGGTGNWNTAAN